MAEPRTVDNLGPEVSARYAEDQSLLDKKILTEASAVRRQAEIDVTTRFFRSEFDIELGTDQRNQFWGQFSAPPGYAEQKKRIFVEQIIPSLGSPDKKEMQLLRIVEMAEMAKKRKEIAEADAKAGKRALAWEEVREFEAVDREKGILDHFFKRVEDLERVLIDINSRRGQYQKG